MANGWRITLILAMCSLTLGWFAHPAYAEPVQQSHSEGSLLRLAQPSPQRLIGNAIQGNSNLSTGVWGGEHIRLEVTEAGATVEYDCAHANISQKIAVDRRGRFVVMGSYVAEHGGPVRESDPSRGVAVQFTGKVSGKKLQLSVRRSDSRKLIGVFTLSLGHEGSLTKCR
jgi:hypothetical protein